MNQAVIRLDERRGRAPSLAAGSLVDMYTLVHKGIRAFMGSTLATVGRMDANDREETAATLAEVRALAMFLRAHLHHENQFVHPALEARRPGSARRTAGDHVEHERALERLEALALAVESADDAARAVAALALYRELALLTAENLEHMHVEETENNATLWAVYTDEELERVHQSLLGSIKPEVMTLGLRWMAQAMTPAERAGLFSHLPPQLLDVARTALSANERSAFACAVVSCRKSSANAPMFVCHSIDSIVAASSGSRPVGSLATSATAPESGSAANTSGAMPKARAAAMPFEASPENARGFRSSSKAYSTRSLLDGSPAPPASLLLVGVCCGTNAKPRL